MKKSLLSLALLAGATIASQAQTALYTCEFGPDYNSKGVSAYDNCTFNVTYPKTNGSTWVVTNYNNNKTSSSGDGTWTYIKAGHKSTGNTATIVNQTAYPQKITKVVVTIDKILSFTNMTVEDYISSVALYIGDEQSVTASTATAKVEFDVADFPSTVIGSSATPYELTFEIPAADQAENQFYSFSMTFPSHSTALSTNGIVQVSKLEYFGESTKESAYTEFPETSYTAVLGETFESPKATTESDGAITYSSSNTAVATIDAESGEVTLHAIGSAVITATSAETDTYYEGQGSYTLTVVLPDKTYEKATSLADGSYLLATPTCDAVATYLDESKTYGYLYMTTPTVEGSKLTTSAMNALTFTNTDEGWTIQDCYGRYLYVSGSYASFNLSTAPTSGQYWDVTLDSSSSKVTIVNKLRAETAGSLSTVLYTVYNETTPEFCLADPGDDYEDYLPVLYAVEGSAAINAVAVDNAAAPVEYYNLQGIRVTNPANGIYIKRQGSSAIKVIL